MKKPRGRELGLPFPGQTGQHNAITDVPGVEVGYCTRIEGEPPLVQGNGPIRSGVTAILPVGRNPEPQAVWAGMHALNGNGEMTGTHWIHDGGYFVGPICITNTQTEHLWAMPVVAETYDGVLNDINGLHITEFDAMTALDSACIGPVAEGNVGGGTGMICYEFKGGTGTSSRHLTIDNEPFIVAALVQANHGIRPWFTPLGKHVGAAMTNDRLLDNEQGSIIVILATDIPMAPHQLRRLAKRAAIGIGRGGTPGGNSSGDIFLAFSTANRGAIPQLAGARRTLETINDGLFDPIYLAATEAIEESVINAMVAAESMTTLRPPDKICQSIDTRQLVSFFSD